VYPFFENRYYDDSEVLIELGINKQFPLHFHEGLELMYCKSGEVEIIINENKYLCREGDFCFTDKYDLHSYDSLTPSEVIFVVLPYDFIRIFDEKVHNYSFERNMITKNENTKKIERLMSELLSADPSDIFLIKGNFYLLYSEIFNKVNLVQSGKTSDDTLREILIFIQSHYTEPLTLDQISKELGYSKYYISRIFNSYIHANINDYINCMRVRLAAKLIVHDNMSISDAYYTVGFTTQRNFNQAFKKYYNATPSKLREQKFYPDQNIAY